MPYASKAAQQRYQREWCARRRALFFKGKRCEWCSATERLELHHQDPSRKENHAIWSWGEKRRETEIAKCVVLCHDCHHGAHAVARRIEAELTNPCGTTAAYSRGCRCQPCRDAHTQAERQRLARKREAA